MELQKGDFNSLESGQCGLTSSWACWLWRRIVTSAFTDYGLRVALLYRRQTPVGSVPHQQSSLQLSQ
jgi:hypothetical protein